MKKSFTLVAALAFIIFSNQLSYAFKNIRGGHALTSTTESRLLVNNPLQTAPKKAAKPAAKPAAKATAKGGGFEKGKNLISKSDCLTCHKLDVKIIGPAYNDVAKKYPSNKANIDLLAEKVINGGAGVWGQIPMSPHPALSKDDAQEMIKYILSLKSK